MTSFDDLLSQVPLAQIADKSGVDQATATNAVKAALPTLLSGVWAEATEPEGIAFRRRSGPARRTGRRRGPCRCRPRS
ncbi:DUF937 domain-containing protein [Nocardia nepalensis]|uniref:DUF937 domain-containing protein n=1 Tax=Nocardia nepalensis TaxID=3375448 RepID=UPI003B67186A